MGFIAFVISCLFILGIAWVGVWAAGYIAPGHPAIVDRLIWGIAIMLIIVSFLQAVGVMQHDPIIPHIN